jgi:FkbM family methyltransferase
MGRSTARMITAFSRTVTALESPMRRAMTYSRVVGRLEQDVAQVIQTARGPLKVLALRGPHLAAAAIGFADEEPETLAWIDGFAPGEALWDIGAATGLLSMYAALAGVYVMAFEPSATSHGVLVEHLALNGLGAKVSPFCLAFSDQTSIERITHSSLAPGSGGNAVGGAPNQFGETGSVFEQASPVYRIDDFRRIFALPTPDHIKLDVDGLEGAILRGAPETLPQVKSLLIEVEGLNAQHAAERIEPPLIAAGFVEDLSARGKGSGRNRVYRRAG